ncbi:MAG: PaaI family thioesterase [Polyangiaceae bacterium]
MSVDPAEILNTSLDGWCRAMAVRFLRVTVDEVVAELTVGPQHRQPHGIVHGGVYTGVIETVASMGASLDAMSRGQTAVGLENHTSFLRAVREGTLTATARPLVRGRRSQVWEATITTAEGKVAARGTVRLLCINPADVAARKT